MICKSCRHCGLCSGFAPGGTISISSELCRKNPFSCDSSLPPNHIGIAVDIGTTSIAAGAYTLRDGKPAGFAGQPNAQIPFGADVVSRISYSMEPGGLERLHGAVIRQIESLCRKLVMESHERFLSRRQGRAELKRIVLAGNTAMECFALGISAAPLAQFPFSLPSEFGFSVEAERLFGSDSPLCGADVYFAPAVQSFVGGDTFCSMAACGFFDSGGTSRFLADIGTNCELCVYSAASKEIVCTSTSAGPAFEGYGIECGIPSQEGAVYKVQLDGGKIKCFAAGGPEIRPRGMCGTGLVSAAASLYKGGLIDGSGAFSRGEEKIVLADGIYLTQKDIRNFQLAKSAVASALCILSEEASCTSGTMYLAGGFGMFLDAQDAIDVGMIPQFLSVSPVSAGNASLCGASLLLLDKKLCRDALSLARSVRHIDLAQNRSFEKLFLQNLNFPRCF